MSRPLRLEYAGAYYHITSRGDRRGAIYFRDDDRIEFNRLLAEVTHRCRWRVHAWCQMTNHYHLLVETPEPNLSQGMRLLNGGYANYFNRAHNRVGHVFQGRYISINVQQDSYLLELARYVVLNPVRAGMVKLADDWFWSSYSATVGARQSEYWLTTNAVLSLFGTRRDVAIAGYRCFVNEGIGVRSPWLSLRNGIFLGDERFVQDLLLKQTQSEMLDEIPRIQRRRAPRPLGEWVSTSPNRNTAIALAYESGSYTLREIAEYFGLHYSRISRIAKANKPARAKGKT